MSVWFPNCQCTHQWPIWYRYVICYLFDLLFEGVIADLTFPFFLILHQTYLEKIADQFEVDWQPTIKLTTDQMIEPMAAPVGYSVHAAQGTGLGPDAHEAMTGTRNVDEEINFQKGNAIPPAAPSGFGGPSGPVVSATAYTPQSKGGSDNLPSTTPTAYVPGPGEGGTTVGSPLTQATTNVDNNAYDEVDIFVPHVPTAPPSGSPANGNKKDDDDDDNQKPPANDGGSTATGSGGASTYEDLAARFEQLNK